MSGYVKIIQDISGSFRLEHIMSGYVR